jgi:FlaA1/EpsC-like NDP-sugar epimerase
MTIDPVALLARRLVPSRRLMGFLDRHRWPLQSAVDVSALAGAVVLGWLLRVDFHPTRIEDGRLVLYLLYIAVLQVAVGTVVGLYKGRYRYGSFEEAAALVRTATVVSVAGCVVNVLMPRGIPTSVPVIAGFVSLLLMAGARYLWRLLLEYSGRPTGEDIERVLVFGAGEGASQLVTSMLRDHDGGLVPIGLLDDDPRKRNRQLRGVPVLGDRHAMGRVARSTGATVLAIAIPSAESSLIREVSELATDAGLTVLVLPPVSELLHGRVGIGQLRTLTERDLLGRHEINTDIDSIAGYLTGKRVLVTGAGGSIGSELCRQIDRFAPGVLIKLDRDESALHGVELSIKGRALLDGGDLVVADIRDEERIREVFAQHRPQVVFHAAALKHLTLLEQHPSEGIKTNVQGTLNVLRAAMEVGVERFVNISTDKAADPISVLGQTKRIAERLTAWAAAEVDRPYLSVRFGNVLGSRGSVLTAFRRQIEDGGPVTVTDPEVTRYFMTVEEAVQLVVQAGAIGRGGEALVLDMGEPVKIEDVAQRLVEESGRPIRIVHTGLRHGEKLHEALLAEDEADRRPVHPLISHVVVPPVSPDDATHLSPGDLATLDGSGEPARASTRTDCS